MQGERIRDVPPPPLPPAWGGLSRDRPFASRAEADTVARQAEMAMEQWAEQGGGGEVEDEDEEVVFSLTPPESPRRRRRMRVRARDVENHDSLMSQEVVLDEFERKKAQRYEAICEANRALNERLRSYHDWHCQRDMMYAFLYAYDEQGMDESLASMVNYVLKQYALDESAPSRYQTPEAEYVRETFRFIVEKSKSRIAKLALVLFTLAYEPRVEAHVRRECPPENDHHFSRFMDTLRYLALQTLKCKYNRQNIRNVLAAFVTRAGAAYKDQVAPAGMQEKRRSASGAPQ